MCEDMGNADVFSLPYKLAVGKVVRPKFMALLKKGEDTLLNRKDSMIYLLEELFPGDSSRSKEIIQKESLLSFVEDVCPPITMGELEIAIKSLKKGKAPGLDLVLNEMIKIMYETIPDLFVKLYNVCLCLGHFISNWKISEVTLLLKEGKDVTKANAYRPICLISNFGKIFEKILLNRALFFANTKHILSDKQFGFISSKSTVMALDNCFSQVLRNLEDECKSVLISFDIKNAFNEAWWISILRLLKKYEFPDYLRKTLSSFLIDRTVQCDTGLEVIIKKLEKGCPQGSCLSPFLWNLIMNDLLTKEDLPGSLIQAYADDILVIIKGSTRREIQWRAENMVRRVIEWSRRHCLVLDVKKTQALLVQRGLQKLKPDFTLGSDDFRVSFTSQIKYLGVIIDENLSFLPHVTSLKNKIDIITERLKRMTTRSSGLKPLVLHKMYKATIERMILYAAESWYFCPTKKLETKINSLVRGIFILITGAYRTTSTVALFRLVGSPLLTMKCKFERKLFLTKMGRSALDYRETIIVKSNLELNEDLSRWNPRERFSLKYSKQDGTREDLRIFTDGSKNKAGVGAAFIVFYKDTEVYRDCFAMNKFNSTFQAEGVAIIEALQWTYVSRSLLCASEVTIYSDCESILICLGNILQRNPLVCKIKYWVYKLTLSGWKVFFKWTPAHSGDRFNEQADTLAKEAVYSTKFRTTEFPASLLRLLRRSSTMDDWREHWTTVANATSVLFFCENWTSKVLSSDTYITQILTGHGQFANYLHRFGKKSDDLCKCGAKGTVMHYLRDCKLFSDLRKGFSTRLEELKDILTALTVPRDRKICVSIVKELESQSCQSE